MRVLVTGANGFIGANVVSALLAADVDVVCGVRDVTTTQRRFPDCEVMAIDFNQDCSPQVWLPRLRTIDAVVNCVGVLRATKRQSINAIHIDAPQALFKACEQAKIKRVVHISALGIADTTQTEYANSKRAADEYLLNLDLSAVVLRPSLVVAPGSYGGTSLFRGLAGLPGFIPMMAAGQQLMQPIAMDDLARTVVLMLTSASTTAGVVNVVGPERIAVADLLTAWRRWLGFAAAKTIAIPLWLMWIVACMGEFVGKGPINKTAYTMLLQDNVADYNAFAKVIDFKPQTFAQMLNRHPSYVQDRWHARLYLLRPLLRFVIGLLWVLSGLLPLLAGHAQAAQWMSYFAIPTVMQASIFYAVASVDILIGLATWWGWRLTLLGSVQISLILFYTVVASLALPQLWLNTFGPLLKNIPIIVAIMVMIVLEEQR